MIYTYLFKFIGSFPTCDICNNANDMLISREVRFTPDQRDVIEKFRQLHLIQQSTEREKQEEAYITVINKYLLKCNYYFMLYYLLRPERPTLMVNQEELFF